MKIKYNNDYYKVLDSEIPGNYQELVQILPEIISPEPLPPTYHLRYRDLEDFPIKVSNQRSYKVMLEEKKKAQGEIILFITTEDQDEDFRDINNNMRALTYESQANHIPPFPSMNYGASNQYQPLTRSSFPLGLKKEEANTFPMMNSNSPPTTVDEIFAANRSENPQADYNKRFLQMMTERNSNIEAPKVSEDPALEDVKLVAFVLDALTEDLPDRSGRKKKFQPDSDTKGPKLRSETKALKEEEEKEVSSSKKDTKKSQKKVTHDLPTSENDEDNFDIVKKKLKTTLPLRSTGGVNRVESRHLKPIRSIKQLKEKWQEDCVIETDPSHYTLKVTPVLHDNPRAAGFKFNKSISNEKAEIIMKDMLHVLKGQIDSIQDLTIDLKNCHSISKTGLIKILQTISENFKNVHSLDLDFSYDRHRHKYTPLPGEITLDLKHLEKLTLNLRLRPDLNNDEIYEFIKGVQKNSKNLKDLKVIRPLWPESNKFVLPSME